MQSSRLGQLVLRQAFRPVGQRQVSYGAVSTKSSYNDLPQPNGNWKTHYDAQQRKNNATLAIGILALGGTILFGKVAGFLEFYNEFPERPATIESYK